MILFYVVGFLLFNVVDFYIWIQVVYVYQLVSVKSLVKVFFLFELNDGKELDYGYGWILSKIYDRLVVEYGGGINGFLIEFIYIFEEEFFVVVFFNCNC